MSEFKKYRRTQVAEIREVTVEDIDRFQTYKKLESIDKNFKVSISDADIANGSPKIGDMIARNPDNHSDQWLIAEDYFQKNFESVV